MASLLSLNDDCLHGIVSCLDDPCSFYSIALSCKRLLQVTKSTRNVIHSKLLRSKAEFYIKSYLVDITNINGRSRGADSPDPYDKYCRLRDLLHGSARLTETKGILSYAKVIDIWQKNGPVVAKLFTWIRNQESNEKEGWPRATCITKYESVTLHLASCDKDMVIKTKYFHDYIGNYDDELSIHVTCGDLDITSEGFTRYCPEDLLYWEEEAIPAAAKPMKPVIELLQKELGDTTPPITDLFFVWLCFFFPGGNNLLEEHRLSFKDAGRNEKPTPGSVQAAVDLFDKNLQTEAKFQDLVSEWKKDDKEESQFSKKIVETIHLLSQRSETKLLQRLEEDAARFYHIASDYKLKKFPKQLLLELVLRTSLEESNYNAGSVSDKFVENTVYFRSLGGKVIKLWGGMHGDGYPTWEQLELQVTLPDGKELKLDTGYFNYRSKKRPCLPIEELSPVTDLLQQGIDDRMQGEKIPKIGNMFTAIYFLHALEFSEVEETFLGDHEEEILIESDEELSSEDSEP
ncbi:hypothetical protein ACROYT_G004403 [Oculina patagonica]